MKYLAVNGISDDHVAVQYQENTKSLDENGDQVVPDLQVTVLEKPAYNFIVAQAESYKRDELPVPTQYRPKQVKGAVYEVQGENGVTDIVFMHESQIEEKFLAKYLSKQDDEKAEKLAAKAAKEAAKAATK